MRQPHIPARPKRTQYHGIARQDEYAWLQAKNWRTVLSKPSALPASIRRVLEKEQRYCDRQLRPIKPLERELFAEMKAAQPAADASPPTAYGHWAWQQRHPSHKEHAQIYRLERAKAFLAGARGQKILDANLEAKGYKNFRLAGFEPSPDSTKLAWMADTQGTEYFTIRIRDCATRQDYDDILEKTSGAVAWSACGQYIFYIALNRAHQPEKVMRHKLGTKQTTDACIYQERDRGFFIAISSMRSGQYIAICVHNHETSETHLLQAHTPLQAPRCFARRRKGVEYYLDHDQARARWIIRTNRNHAMDFCLMSAPEGKHAPKHWRVCVPHKCGQFITNHAVFARHIVWARLSEANTKIYVQTLSPRKTRPRSIAVSEACYDLAFDAGLDYDTNNLRVRYSSFTTALQIFDYALTRLTRQLRYTQTLRTPHRPSDYHTRRLWARAADGARIPISLVWHKRTTLRRAPLLLYAYGAYGISTPARFSLARLGLLKRGVVYAIAHVRGGRECGQAWFLQGRKHQKINSFTDCIAAAQKLIAQRITAPKRIVLHGGSAGGLLVGACVNLAPELFCAAIADVPFVDTLTTMLNADLPLTPPEWPEWGNPITSKRDYRTIAAYAPYENIRATTYPHILATTGLCDPRVTYWEPAKWIARLRARRVDQGLSLLHITMQAGHSGQAGRWNILREAALRYGLALYILKHNLHTT